MKIFFSDLDGTLLDHAKKIGDRTRRALEGFIDAGGYFAVSTGRAMESAMAIQKELGLFYPRTFLIAYNGAQIYDCDRKKSIYRIGIDRELVGRIFALAAKHRVHIHTYNDIDIVSPPVMDEQDAACIDYYRHAIHSPLLFTEDVLSHLPFPPGKCIAIELKDLDKLEAFRKELEPMVSDTLTLLYSCPNYLEIFRKEAGKGAGLKNLCEYLHIPLSEAMAAGDEENDLSMIQAAGFGIAMKNGNPLLFDKADAVTEEDNDHDGLASYLEKFRP
ncbi:MAG: Cof-type HAD-IIB family hydrolase [Lachnospiraceae bacterium]|nr:Cof-type HAD-IIB family hydrolase [Lachnospiraceae bacterium]